MYQVKAFYKSALPTSVSDFKTREAALRRFNDIADDISNCRGIYDRVEIWRDNVCIFDYWR